jgi:hypothetical protein
LSGIVALLALFASLLGRTARADGLALPEGTPAEDSESARSVPPRDDAGQPPAEAGADFIDPAFGTPVRRLTNAKAEGAPLLTHDYSRSSAMNDDDTLLLIHGLDSRYALYTTGGARLHELPGVAGGGAEPRWIRGDPRRIFFLRGNAAFTMDVHTRTEAMIAEFPGYDSVSSGGEQELSEDGDHYALMGYRGGRPVEAFLLTLSTGATSPKLDLASSGRTPNWVGVTPDNEMLVMWNPPIGPGRFFGTELYDAQMRFVRQISSYGAHGDVCRDPSGDAVLIQSNAASPAPDESSHWLDAHRLSDGRVTHLLRLQWEQVPHISCRSTGPADWVTISTYVPADPQAAKFVPFDNEIFRVALDGSRRVRRLAHTRSRPLNPYFFQPRVSESRSGRFAVFASNFGRSASGNPHYVDTYLLPLHSSDAMPAGPLGRDAGGSQTTVFIEDSTSGSEGGALEAERRLLVSAGPRCDSSGGSGLLALVSLAMLGSSFGPRRVRARARPR